MIYDPQLQHYHNKKMLGKFDIQQYATKKTMEKDLITG